jgi:hypothetical protein
MANNYDVVLILVLLRDPQVVAELRNLFQPLGINNSPATGRLAIIASRYLPAVIFCNFG